MFRLPKHGQSRLSPSTHKVAKYTDSSVRVAPVELWINGPRNPCRILPPQGGQSKEPRPNDDVDTSLSESDTVARSLENPHRRFAAPVLRCPRAMRQHVQIWSTMKPRSSFPSSIGAPFLALLPLSSRRQTRLLVSGRQRRQLPSSQDSVVSLVCELLPVLVQMTATCYLAASKTFYGEYLDRSSPNAARVPQVGR